MIISICLIITKWTHNIIGFLYDSLNAIELYFNLLNKIIVSLSIFLGELHVFNLKECKNSL
jgi:hypothetical protein